MHCALTEPAKIAFSTQACRVGWNLVGWSALSLLGVAVPAWAQAPAPSNAASAAASQDRSQDPAYSVFRWIKIQGDAPRKTEPAKPKPKTESATAVVRKPDAPATAAPEIVERTDTRTTSAAPSAQPETNRTPPSVVAAPPPAPTPAPAPATTVATAAPAAPPPAPEPEVEADLKLISQAQPAFPRELRREISHGKITVRFTVQPDGTVAEPSVVSYSNRQLNRPALEAISKWKFEPIQTARTVQVEIEFDL